MKNPNYSQKMKSLTGAQRMELDKEYETNKFQGQVEFTSKVTGLKYAIPENANKTFKGSELEDVQVSAKRKVRIPLEKPAVPKVTNPANNTAVSKKPVSRLAPKGQEKYYQDLKENKDFSAVSDNFKRSLIPTGNNTASYVNKKVTGSNRMDNNSLDKDEKALLYKVVDQAKKRSGSRFKGGTEYEDYKAVMSPSEYNELKETVKGNINPIIGTINGKTSKAYDLATTLGRVSYSGDDKGNVIVTDTYDFKNSYTQDKSGALKKDYMKGNNSTYAKLRKAEAAGDQNLSKAQEDKLKASIKLTPSDTVGRSSSGSVISTPTLQRAGGALSRAFKEETRKSK